MTFNINNKILKKNGKDAKVVDRTFETHAHKGFILLSRRIPNHLCNLWRLEMPTIGSAVVKIITATCNWVTPHAYFSGARTQQKQYMFFFIYFWIACAETSSVYVMTVKFNTYRFCGCNFPTTAGMMK